MKDEQRKRGTELTVGDATDEVDESTPTETPIAEDQESAAESTLKSEADSTSDSSASDPSTNGEDSPEVTFQVIDLHEVRSINQTLTQLKDYGIDIHDFLPVGIKDGETYHPFVLSRGETKQPLQSLRELVTELRDLGEKSLVLTRFKGLGEMNPDELWETTMDPSSRLLMQVTLNDAASADEMFRVLMGDQVEPRREFIEKHALEVEDLDI